MTRIIITQETLNTYRIHLQNEEKSKATIDKYMRDAHSFAAFAEDFTSTEAAPCAEDSPAITKELTMAYKQSLVTKGYALRSVNSRIASLNNLLKFLGKTDARLKSLKQQREIFVTEDKELSRAEYLRLLDAAKDNKRLYLLLQTICATGIRISELQYFTADALRSGKVVVRCKNKTRIILVPRKLCKRLLAYADQNAIKEGPVFRTRHGNPLDRSNIWSEMKKLCAAAGVASSKVFPHNLRKLFARTFYKIEKDIAKLADILGHSSIETTRIYIMTTGQEHRRLIERLNLLRQ